MSGLSKVTTCVIKCYLLLTAFWMLLYCTLDHQAVIIILMHLEFILMTVSLWKTQGFDWWNCFNLILAHAVEKYTVKFVPESPMLNTMTCRATCIQICASNIDSCWPSRPTRKLDEQIVYWPAVSIGKHLNLAIMLTKNNTYGKIC